MGGRWPGWELAKRAGSVRRWGGGFYLSEPKAGSSGTIDLDSVVAEVLVDHANLYPPLEIELPDITSGEPVHRTAQLMISTTRGNPFTDRTRSREWTGWRDAAGWPTHGTFHSLRHFCATTHITNHADPKDVQRLLRHKSLEIYVHWWPRRDRQRGLIGNLLRAASTPKMAGGTA